MGKGDKKSRRGKITIGSHGVRRPRRISAHKVVVKPVAEEKPVKAQKEKPAPKPKIVLPAPIIDAPVADITAEVAEKPAKKKSAPKAKATKKEEPAEE